MKCNCAELRQELERVTAALARLEKRVLRNEFVLNVQTPRIDADRFSDMTLSLDPTRIVSGEETSHPVMIAQAVIPV